MMGRDPKSGWDIPPAPDAAPSREPIGHVGTMEASWPAPPKTYNDGLEAAAALLWDDLPEIQRKALRKRHQNEMAVRKCAAAAIRALKGTD